ncbi:MAG: hypothetical protein CTY25_13305 [Methylobacterium sp.]|nr:MAG: hypothetical protein CTY25_13305 [Methylobacterium sp.]
MAKLELWQDAWPLDVNQCPCDVHFTRYLEAQGFKNQRIFHFGTGDHHHVGLQAPSNGHVVLGITATEPEYSSYIRLVVNNPLLGKHYKVLFTDIYQTILDLLPSFDLITMFHVGEFWSANNAPHAILDDEALLEGMIGKLVPGGRLFLYTGSFAYAVPERLIPAVAARNGLIEEPQFESLRVFRKPA